MMEAVEREREMMDNGFEGLSNGSDRECVVTDSGASDGAVATVVLGEKKGSS